MRVATHKGRIIEAQSGDGASMDALKKNALAAGFSLDECEFFVMNDDEVLVRIAEQDSHIPPVKSRLEMRLDAIEARMAALERR